MRYAHWGIQKKSLLEYLKYFIRRVKVIRFLHGAPMFVATQNAVNIAARIAADMTKRMNMTVKME
jgi:hypothetical protein